MTVYVFANRGYIKIIEDYSLPEEQRKIFNRIINTYLPKFKHKIRDIVFITSEKEKDLAIEMVNALEINGFNVKVFGDLQDMKIVHGYIERINPGLSRIVVKVKLFGKLKPITFAIHDYEEIKSFKNFVEENKVCVTHRQDADLSSFFSILTNKGKIPAEYRRGYTSSVE